MADTSGKLTASQFFLGLLATIVAHGSIAAGVFFAASLGEASAAVQEEEEKVVPFKFMETRLVKLGVDRKNRLPNKEIPANTKVEQAPSKAPLPTSKRVERPEDLAEDAKPTATDDLSQLGNRAADLANDARARDREGDPDGVEEGTEKRDEGNIFLGKLQRYFRRDWDVPDAIADAELKQLIATVSIEIADGGRMGGYKWAKKSGNAAFDASVKKRLDDAVGEMLPDPPEELWGTAVNLNFRGKDARR